MVESSSDTSREGGSRFFLASVDTSRESGGEEVEGAGLTRLVKLAVGFLSFLFHLCVESRSTRWWLEDSATIGLSWRKQQLVFCLLRKPQISRS